jgi:transcriptional regulator with XRE-family HTH domain
MNNANIANQIKQLRKQKGYTQEKLGEILNVSTQSISKWECASTYPDISLLPKIATIFGITIDELFSQTIDEDLSKIIGEIVKVDKSGVYVQAKQGVVILKDIQLQGKKRMLINDFMNGVGKSLFRLGKQFQ